MVSKIGLFCNHNYLAERVSGGGGGSEICLGWSRDSGFVARACDIRDQCSEIRKRVEKLAFFGLTILDIGTVIGCESRILPF
jgi:hypothetical protein